jgi:exoribonuclease-2
MATAVEAAALLLALHSAPIYFHRKGKGRFRKAPAEILQAALAGLEKKRQQALSIERMVGQLKAFSLPPEFPPMLGQLLYKPDRNRGETKALEAACSATGPRRRTCCKLRRHPLGARLSPAALSARTIPARHGFPGNSKPPPCRSGLPRADVQAFSIDDATTTEIDDAFRCRRCPASAGESASTLPPRRWASRRDRRSTRSRAQGCRPSTAGQQDHHAAEYGGRTVHPLERPRGTRPFHST